VRVQFSIFLASLASLKYSSIFSRLRNLVSFLGFTFILHLKLRKQVPETPANKYFDGYLKYLHTSLWVYDYSSGCELLKYQLPGNC
jgi:hypothetical protein